MTFMPKPIKTEGFLAGAAAHLEAARDPAADKLGTLPWAEFRAQQYNNLDVVLDPVSRACWSFMRPTQRPSFTMDLMHDISEMQRSIQHLFSHPSAGANKPFDYFILASSIPGIYNLGGDLRLFGELIRAGDLAALRRYGHVAVEAIHRNAMAFHSPIVTIALVQGDALGGGFECALSLDLIVAERSAKFGLPEILFNMFPGMGAYSFLSRRLDRVRAEKLILSGQIYTAEVLYDMGVVDILAEDGHGQDAVLDYIDRHRRKHNAYLATFQARRKVNPVTLEELRDVVDIWAAAALNLTEFDLRKMARLAAAQDRRCAAIPAPAAAAE